MPDPRDDHYLEPYRAAQLDHGSDKGVTLWANERTQHLRFQVMTEMVSLADKRVLDVGCSRGDFAVYLQDQGHPYEQYVGLDGLPEVIDFARSRAIPDARFEVCDVVADPSRLVLDAPEVITFSGTLNTMPDEMVFTLLGHAWDAALEALIFNYLSDTAGQDAPQQTNPARRLPTLKLLDWAMQQTPNVAMRQDYFPHGHDATVVMLKG